MTKIFTQHEAQRLLKSIKAMRSLGMTFAARDEDHMRSIADHYHGNIRIEKRHAQTESYNTLADFVRDYELKDE